MESDLLRLLMAREKAEASPDQEFIRKISFEEDHPSAGPRQSLDVFDSLRLSAHSVEKKKVSDPSTGRVAVVPAVPTFWQSEQAAKLFNPLPNESPEDAVNKMIDILERATTHPKNCWSIVKGSRNDVRMLKEEDLHRIYTKAVYIKETLYLSRSTINEASELFSFRKCCNQIVQIVGETVKPHNITAGYTIGEWFRDFRTGRAFTHHKCRSYLEAVALLLAFFDDEPDLCKLFKLQLASNLPGLSAKRAYHMFFKNIVAMASSKRRCEPEDLIFQYGMDQLQEIHFHNWLKDQDFKEILCPDSSSVVWAYMETVDV